LKVEEKQKETVGGTPQHPKEIFFCLKDWVRSMEDTICHSVLHVSKEKMKLLLG
jgi:hypothetical protein